MYAYKLSYIFGSVAGSLLLLWVFWHAFRYMTGRKQSLTEAAESPGVLVAAFALIVASLFAFEYSDRKSKHFLASERPSFVASCTETAKKALGQHKAPKFCNCLRSEIEEVYSYLEYGKFNADIERGTIPVEVSALAEKCRAPN